MTPPVERPTRGVLHAVRTNAEFFGLLVTLGVPMALQNLISSCLGLVDTVMLGRLGEAPLAAVGLANQVFFFFLVFTFGIASGTNVFIAQYWGKGDVAGVHRATGVGLTLSVLLAVPFTLAGLVWAVPVMHVFSHDHEVVRLGALFLRVTALGNVLFGVNMAYSFGLRALGIPRPSAVIGSIALGFNTVTGYILIFGMGFVPAYGVAGAAWAIVASRVLELALTLSYIYGRRTVLAAPLRELFSFGWGFVRQYLRTAGAVILNEGLWSLAMVMVTVAYSKLGTRSVAAFQISNTIQSLFFVVIFGVGNATAVIVGNQVGAGNPARAREYARLSLLTSAVLGACMGVAILITSPLATLLFRVTPDTLAIASHVLRVLAAVVTARCLNTVIVVGVLRGGGDTRFSLFMDVGALWLVGVPLAFLGTEVWHLPIYTVIALVASEEIVKLTLGLLRVWRGKWVHDVTVTEAVIEAVSRG